MITMTTHAASAQKLIVEARKLLADVRAVRKKHAPPLAASAAQAARQIDALAIGITRAEKQMKKIEKRSLGDIDGAILTALKE